MSRFKLALAALLTTIPCTAFALDYRGDAGVIREIEINEATADSFLQYHGRLVIDVQVNDRTIAVDYKWGGTSCSNKTLTEAKVALLERAMANGAIVEPKFQSGQGSNKCVVGFVIR